MVKYKVAIQFDENFLKELQVKQNSGVEVCKSTHHLSLHPIQLNNVKKSIKDVLNEGVARYNKELEGILLGYQNIKLLTNEGTIHNDSYYIHFDLQAEFYIFKPEIDKQMQGMVNRKSKDHVGLLVYNAFNVAIPKPKNEENWLGDLVDVGYEVLFRITFFSFSSYMPYIRGEILSILNETENFGESFNTNEQQVNKKIIFEDVNDEKPSKKSRKKKKETQSQQETEQIVVPEKIKKQKKTRKKKEKNTEDEPNISLGDLNLQELFDVSKANVIKKDHSTPNESMIEDVNLDITKTKKRKRTATESETQSNSSSPTKKRKRVNSGVDS